MALIEHYQSTLIADDYYTFVLPPESDIQVGDVVVVGWTGVATEGPGFAPEVTSDWQMLERYGQWDGIYCGVWYIQITPENIGSVTYYFTGGWSMNAIMLVFRGVRLPPQYLSHSLSNNATDTTIVGYIENKNPGDTVVDFVIGQEPNSGAASLDIETGPGNEYVTLTEIDKKIQEPDQNSHMPQVIGAYYSDEPLGLFFINTNATLSRTGQDAASNSITFTLFPAEPPSPPAAPTDLRYEIAETTDLPVARFTNAPESAVLNDAVPTADIVFSNSSLHATSYEWDGANGQTSTDTNPTFTYTEPGFYVVRLTATNDLGSSVYERPVIIERAGVTITPPDGLWTLTIAGDYFYICDTDHDQVIMLHRNDGTQYKTFGAHGRTNSFFDKPTTLTVCRPRIG